MDRNGVTPAPPVRALPHRVELDTLPPSIDGMPVLGIASATLEPATFVPSGPMLLCGPPGSGRTTTMRSLAVALRRWRPEIQLHYFGTARSALAQLPIWSSRVLSVGESGDAAAELAAALSVRAATAPPVAVFLENIAEFANGMGEMAIQQLAKQCAADGHLFVAEGETSAFNSGMGLIGQLKSGRAGLALAPDLGDGPTIFKTNFPRLSGIEMPAGRGLLVRLGKAEVVQIGLTGSG
jgi:S-DNA-T family DNA segregation ATPase FtsK/SpoIIIE